MANVKSYEKFINQNHFYTKAELVEYFGENTYRSFANSLVLKDEEVFNQYKNENLISINIVESKMISTKLLHDLLADEGMYKYLQTNLDNELGIAVRLDYLIDKETFASIKISRVELIECFNEIIDTLTQQEKMRLAVIKSSSLLFSCEQKYHNYSHRVFIEDNILEISAMTLLNILTCDESEFNSFLTSTTSYGYDKDCLAYALVDFIERERILLKYVLPEKAYARYNKIKSYSLIDFEYLNKNRITNDSDEYGESILDKFEISEALQTKLDEDIDKTYSSLEKAIYYYIKLCEILTYDEKYYLHQSDTLFDEHQDLENIKKKSPVNNKVIWYDFILMYAKIISKLNLKFTFDQELIAGTIKEDSKVTFKYSEYLVALKIFAIEEKDFLNIKISDALENLICLNHNELTKKKFSEICAKIYNDIKAKKASRNTFKKALKDYKSWIKYSDISLNEKLYILLKELENSKLTGIDIVSYEKKIFNNLFADSKNIAINILAKKGKSYLTPITIISLHDVDYYYYLFDMEEKEQIRRISESELNDLLSSNQIYYIDDANIPGISKFVGEKYVK